MIGELETYAFPFETEADLSIAALLKVSLAGVFIDFLIDIL